MHLRDKLYLMEEWLDGSFFIMVGAFGVIFVLAGFKRDDLLQPVFILAGLAIAAVGFGVQFFGFAL